MESRKNVESTQEVFIGYGPKTLTSGWNYGAESFPKDLDVNEYDLSLSTYQRLGTSDAKTPSSVARSDQKLALELPRSSREYRSIANVVTYPHLFKNTKTFTDEKPLLTHWETYESTYQHSYVSHTELPLNQPASKEKYKPETKYRRLLTDPNNIRRPNLGAFLDDNMDFLGALRKPISGPPPYGLDYQPKWTWELGSKA